MINIFIYLTEKNQEVLVAFFLIIKKQNWEKDFSFVREVGITFKNIFREIILKKYKKKWKKKKKKFNMKKEGDMSSLICFMTEGQNLDYKLVEMLMQF